MLKQSMQSLFCNPERVGEVVVSNHRLIWRSEQAFCYQVHELPGQAEECLAPIHYSLEGDRASKGLCKMVQLSHL